MGPYQPPPPVPYANVTDPGRRPGSVTAIAIIGIILAALILLNHSAGLLMVMGGAKIWPDDEVMLQTTISTLSILFALILLAGSIGSLLMQPWGRQALLFWAILYIVYDVVGGIIAIAITIESRLENLRGTPQFPIARVAAYFVAVFLLLLMLVLPIFVLVVMRRPRVVAAFEKRHDVMPA